MFKQISNFNLNATSMRKKLFSILALLLTVSGAWAQSNTITVYFTDAQNWGNAYVHYWGGESSTNWPGMEMTFVETNGSYQNVYKASIPSDVTGIIFNGNGNQTVDITTGISDGAWWYTNGDKDGNFFKVSLNQDTYIVAGNNTDIFGSPWDGSNEDNTMAKGDDGKYRKEYTVSQVYNDVQLKVVRNGAEWIGDATGNNVIFNLTDAGTFTVVFDPDEEVASVTGDIVEVITQLDIDNVYAVGNGEGNWLNGAGFDPAYAANEMTEIEPGVWQITYEDVPDGFERQVKFAINGAWDHNFGGTFVDFGDWFDAVYNGDNITFDTDDYCTVTLTLDLTEFDYASKTGAKFKIDIEYQTDQTDIYYLVGPMTDWSIDEAYKLVANAEAEGEYYISGVELKKDDEFKVKSAAGEYFPNGYDNNYVISADGTYDIYLRPNYDGGDDWYYNCIYVADVTPTPEATNISAATVTGIDASYDWTGNEIHPEPVVTLNGNVLSSDTDYDVTYSEGCTNVGEYTVTITGKNDYTGTIVVPFNIKCDVFYLVGTMNNWEINQNYKLVANAEAEGEYYIQAVELSANDRIKVNSAAGVWYPDGMDTDYGIQANGIYDIYFRPDGQGGSDWHEGYFYVAQSAGDFDVALAPTGYGTYYCEDYVVTLPSGVAAYIVTDATPTYEKIADGDRAMNTIPAGTAVLLYSASKPSKVTLSLDLALSKVDDRTFTNNLLHGSDVATLTDTDGAATYYKLTYGNDNTTFGWYWGAAGGDPFTSPAHKVWLALPATGGESRTFLGLPGDDFTGIATIENRQQNADKVWYDLNGRRINAPKTKGVYVKDGRKLVIK